MSFKHTDGAISYCYPDEFTDVLLYGVSVVPLGIFEAKVWPNGYGYVLVKKESAEATPKTWVDGQTKLFILYGDVTIVP